MSRQLCFRIGLIAAGMIGSSSSLAGRTLDTGGYTVPNGWRVEDSIKGELDEDGTPDFVLVLRSKNPKLISKKDDGEGFNDRNPRRLVILLTRPSSSPSTIVDNRLFLPTPEEDENEINDSTPDIKVKNRAIKISFSTLSGDAFDKTYVFRYQHGAVELIGYDESTTHRNTGESSSVSINYSTGIAQSIHVKRVDAKPMTKIVRLRGKPLISIDRIGAADKFSPEVPLPPASFM